MPPLRIFVDLNMPEDVMDLLRQGTEGHELIFPRKPADSVLSKAAPDPQFSSADIAFGQPDTTAIREAPNLKWVQVSSSGITRYDTEEFRSHAASRGLAVCNSASVYAEPCAVQVLAFMLAQARILPHGLISHAKGGSGDWHHLRACCSTLRGENVLILGFGAIGKRLTELLRPFNANVTAFRRRERGDEGVPVVNRDGLERALGETDHVVNILPDSEQTRGFFDETLFAAIKPGAVFYNIGRGVTVNQDALLEALRSARLSAAWLDVTDPEPLPQDHPLRHQPNCFITPHIAGGHRGESASLVRHFLNNFNRYLKGEPFVDRVM